METENGQKPKICRHARSRIPLLGLGSIATSSIESFPLAGACRFPNIAAIVLVPRIDGILIPVVHFLLQRGGPLPAGARPGRHAFLLPGGRPGSLAELVIVLVLTGDGVVRFALALALQHALVVQRAQTQAGQAADD